MLSHQDMFSLMEPLLLTHRLHIASLMGLVCAVQGSAT